MAIDASKFTDKDKLIAKFYTLRAGLSVIAEETEKIKRADEALKKSKQDYNNLINRRLESIRSENEEHIRTYKKNIATNENDIFKYEIDIKNHEAQIKKLQQSNEEARKPELGCFAWIFCIFTALFTWSLGYAIVMAADSSVKMVIPMIVGTIFAFVGTAIVYYLIKTIGLKWAENTVIKQNNNEITRLRSEIERLKSLIEILKNEITSYTANISEISDKNELVSVSMVSDQSVEKEILKAEENFKNNILPKGIALTKSVKQAMLEESKGVISEFDWQNLDLLIFYLETGRADSLMDALQQVDRQRQTNQIVYSIQEASYHISSAIRVGFDRLANLMSSCFSNLERQIQSVRSSIASLEKTVKVGNQDMSSRINSLSGTIMRETDRLVSAQEINNALMKRSNDNSEKLVSLLKENEKYW